MEFEAIYKEYEKPLMGLAHRLNGHLGYISDDDLFQEMTAHLWQRWQKGELADKTKSYIIKSCYFHVKNYIRVYADKPFFVSLNEPVDGEGSQLKDILPDKSVTRRSFVDSACASEIKEMDMTQREKEVLELWAEARTTRDIGQALGISHVRVIKIQENIRRKYITSDKEGKIKGNLRFPLKERRGREPCVFKYKAEAADGTSDAQAASDRGYQEPALFTL